MVRLKDIAQQAGVSVMTVSKVMRDAPDISAETKVRIRALAQQLGYMPDAVAQGLRTRKSRLLGVVLPAVTNPIFPRFLMALEEGAFQLGYDLILAHSLNDVAREEACIRRLLSRRVDGLMIFPVYRLEPNAPIYEELRRRDTPTLILGHSVPFCAGFINLANDDLQASHDVTQHLIGLGHRRIAFFAGPTAAPWTQERLEGYRCALREAQIEFDDRLIFPAGNTIEEGATAMRLLIQESPGITAIQTVNDLVAVGVVQVSLTNGWRVPEDVSVAGFGNYMVSEFNRVPLTTTHQPKHRLGVAAIQAMQKLLHGEQPFSQRLPAKLIVRASTAAPNPGSPAMHTRHMTSAAANS